MNKLLLLCALVFAAACGGKSSGAADPCADPCKDPCKDGKKAAMSCADMGANVEAAMRAGGEMADDMIAEMGGMIVSECNSSAWAQETIDCMGAATSAETAEPCEESMSDEQRESFHAAVGGASEGGMEDEGGME